MTPQPYQPTITDKLLAKLSPKRYFLRRHAPIPGITPAPYLFSFDVDHPADAADLPGCAALFRKYGAVANFAVVGRYVEKFPAEHRALAEADLELLNHSYSHPFHDILSPKRITSLTPEELDEEITQTHRAVIRHTGQRMAGWRTPHFGVQPIDSLYAILARHGYQYSSSLADYHTQDGLPFTREGVIELPLSATSQYPFATFDSWSYLAGPTPIFSTADQFYAHWEHEMSFAQSHGLTLNHYIDPTHVFKNGILKRMLEYCQKYGIRTLTYSTFIAEYRANLARTK